MEGTEEIDKLMIPVLTAIKRHVKDENVITDIYNRAYEAVYKVLEDQKHDKFVSTGIYKTVTGGRFDGMEIHQCVKSDYLKKLNKALGR